MSVAEYRKKFIEPRTLNLPYYQCNLVGVDPKLHNLIKLATANTGLTIGGFVNNILMDHFKKNKPDFLGHLEELFSIFNDNPECL